MPSKGRIQATGFQELLLELGVNPNGIPFDLQSEVLPVVLVGGTVSFLAAPTPPYGVTDIFTAGPLTNPAAGTVLATTGPLPVGAYSLQMVLTATELNNFDFEWRNAANSATLVAIRFKNIVDQMVDFSARFDVLNANERLRVIVVGATGVGELYAASILAKV